MTLKLPTPEFTPKFAPFENSAELAAEYQKKISSVLDAVPELTELEEPIYNEKTKTYIL